MSGDLVKALSNLQEREVISIVQERLKNGEEPLSILEDGKIAMEIVGKRFSEGEYFIPDLVFSAEIMKGITDMVKPKLVRPGVTEHVGKFVIGTVAGDIHDIGKNIVAFMLEVNGFEVYDLGIDVPAQKFVEKIKEVKPQVVGLSGFLTLAYDSMKDTVKAIEAAGLRDRLKIIIGGGQVDENVRKYANADAYGEDAVVAVSFAKECVGGK